MTLSLWRTVIKQRGKYNTIVGHVSRRISASCNAFIRRGGIIQCAVIGSRRYDIDLIQGELEMPCKLLFLISSQEFCKNIEIRFALHYPKLPHFPTSMVDEPMVIEIKMDTVVKAIIFCSTSINDKPEDEPMVAEIKMDTVSNSHSGSEPRPLSPPVSLVAICDDNQTSQNSVLEDSIVMEEFFVHHLKSKRKKINEEEIIMEEKLTDNEIDLAQRILKSQFPNLNGLHSTLLQSKACTAAD